MNHAGVAAVHAGERPTQPVGVRWRPMSIKCTVTIIALSKEEIFIPYSIFSAANTLVPQTEIAEIRVAELGSSRIMTDRLTESAPVFVDPGFSVGGVMITDVLRKAYLMKKPEPRGIWVSEGENFMGWRVQSIGASTAKLQQNHHTIELRLYPEK